MQWKFKQQFSYAQRKNESSKIIQKYPERIPVIVQRAPRSPIAELDKCKFLVPLELTVSQFIWILRMRLQVDHQQAIYMFVGRTLPQSTTTMGDLYAQCQDEDRFLYVLYSGESTFGSDQQQD